MDHHLCGWPSLSPDDRPFIKRQEVHEHVCRPGRIEMLERELEGSLGQDVGPGRRCIYFVDVSSGPHLADPTSSLDPLEDREQCRNRMNVLVRIEMAHLQSSSSEEINLMTPFVCDGSEKLAG